MSTHDENGWSEYEKLVIYRLDALDTKVEKLAIQQVRTNEEVIHLRSLASVWGAVGGAIISSIVAMIFRPKG